MAAIESALPGIADRPALLIWAPKDRAFNPGQLQRWQTLFRNLDGPHLLPTAGHFSQEDAPDEIVPRLRAWAGARFRAGSAQAPR
jgi:haloalkane dehalogenase